MPKHKKKNHRNQAIKSFIFYSNLEALQDIPSSWSLSYKVFLENPDIYIKERIQFSSLQRLLLKPSNILIWGRGIIMKLKARGLEKI